MGLGIVWAILVKPTYQIRVASALGEDVVLPKATRDKKYVDRVVNAINEALIKRG